MENPQTLLLGMIIGTATMQSSIIAPPRTTGETLCHPDIPFPEYTSRKQQKLSLEVSHEPRC